MKDGNKSNNSKSDEEEEEETEKEEEQKEEDKPKVNHYIPDKENPYNNMNMENPEIDELEDDDYTVLCWYCKKPIVIEDGWNMFECGNCHRMNRLPQKLIKEIYYTDKLKNVYFNKSINHLDKIIPIVYIIVNCPYCKASNKVDRNTVRCKCFVCERGFYVDRTIEDVKPIEQVSLNPNSRYYKFKGCDKDVPRRVYPPHNVYRVSEFNFPEPVNYDNDYYYNNGLINKLYYSDFQYNQDHQLQFMNPYRSITPSPNIISKNEVNEKINNANNIMEKNVNDNLRKTNEIRQNEKLKLYSNLFFMK
jgi:hypothetical protein